jgi:hypothetical protein
MNGGDWTQYLNCIRTVVYDRRLIVTKRGYMGLAPAVTQVGDLCGIIFGCSMPCILRRASQHSTYNFLGATYIPGTHSFEPEVGGIGFYCMGWKRSKDWVEWDIEEQDIYLV